MTVKITPNDKGNPPGKLADAELHFTDVACPACLGDREVIVTDRGPLAGAFGICATCDGTGVLAGSNQLTGLKLIGFSVWERRDGTRHVTFPARSCSVNGERRNFALLRHIVDTGAQNTVRELILQAYQEYADRVLAGL